MPEDLRPKDLSSAQVAGNTSKSADSPTSHEKEGGIALDPSNETACRQFFDRAQTTPGFFDKVGLVQDTYWSVPFEQLMFLLLEQDDSTISEFLKKCPHSIDSQFLNAFLCNLYLEVTSSNARALAQYLVDVFENVRHDIDQSLYDSLIDFLDSLVLYDEYWDELANLNLPVIFSYDSFDAFDYLLSISSRAQEMKDFLIFYCKRISTQFRQQHLPNFSSSQLIEYSQYFHERFQQEDNRRKILGSHAVYYMEPDDPNKEPSESHQVIAIYPKGDLQDKPTFFVRRNPAHAIAALTKAREVLPDFVSSSFYPELPELDDEKSAHSIFQGKNRRNKIGRHGYREVYAGETIGRLGFYQNIPPEIIEDIFAQRTYILIQLLSHGIHHNDSTNYNFNVRWLLKNKDGAIITIAFTLDNALRKAREQNLTLTPIVTLRDWEYAEYHPEEAWGK